MKITKEQLKQIIKEELEAVQEEGLELPSFRDIGDMIFKSPEERAASRKRKAERAVIDQHRLVIMCHEYKQCGKLFRQEKYKGLDDKGKQAQLDQDYAELLKHDKYFYKAAKNDPFSYPSPYEE